MSGLRTLHPIQKQAMPVRSAGNVKCEVVGFMRKLLNGALPSPFLLLARSCSPYMNTAVACTKVLEQ